MMAIDGGYRQRVQQSNFQQAPSQGWRVHLELWSAYLQMTRRQQAPYLALRPDMPYANRPRGRLERRFC